MCEVPNLHSLLVVSIKKKEKKRLSISRLKLVYTACEKHFPVKQDSENLTSSETS